MSDNIRRAWFWRPLLGKGTRFWGWFTIALAVMAGVNAVPLYQTWGAAGLDGLEIVGWPLPFFERGGQGFVEVFRPECLFIDFALAVGISYAIAFALKDGWKAFFHWARTAGTPLAE